MLLEDFEGGLVDVAAPPREARAIDAACRVAVNHCIVPYARVHYSRLLVLLVVRPTVPLHRCLTAHKVGSLDDREE